VTATLGWLVPSAMLLSGSILRLSYVMGKINSTMDSIVARVKQLEDNENATMQAVINGYRQRPQ
jgi:hypothetical protein